MDKTEAIAEPTAEEFWAKSDLTVFFNLSADLFSIFGPDGSFKKINPGWKKVLAWTDKEWRSPSASTDINDVYPVDIAEPQQAEEKQQHRLVALRNRRAPIKSVDLP